MSNEENLKSCIELPWFFSNIVLFFFCFCLKDDPAMLTNPAMICKPAGRQRELFIFHRKRAPAGASFFT
jgi:ABC-type multidrug transport system permease subunit